MSLGSATPFNVDFDDLLRALNRAQVKYVVVGAHALAVHGFPRATGDLDIFVQASDPNAERVMAALRDFGAPVEAHGIAKADFAIPGTVYQMGLPPRRIDLITAISGVDFQEAWASRTIVEYQDVKIPVIGLDALLKNKLATGRQKDQLDAELLQGLQRQE